MSAADVLAGRARWALMLGDVRAKLAELPDESVQCVVTSPPYFGLRDYGTATWEGGDPDCDHKKVADPVAAVATSTLDGGKKSTGPVQEGFKKHCARCGAVRVDRQIGLEPTPADFVEAMVVVFREVRRVLRSDGTCWVNLGDSYVSGQGGRQSAIGEIPKTTRRLDQAPWKGKVNAECITSKVVPTDLAPKQLVGIPWRVAFALQADGWWLRSDVIWAKPNPMPESVTDRPTRSHEYLFLLTKSARYAYDADAIREPAEYGRVEYPNGVARSDRTAASTAMYRNVGDARQGVERGMNKAGATYDPSAGRNRRSVWTIAPEPFPEAHFATFPPALVEPCILAGTSERGCCPTCGAPWRRITKPTAEYAALLGKDWADDEQDAAEGRGHFVMPDGSKASQRRTKRDAPSVTASYETVGWEPTCTHGGDPIPCLVLDPFVGAGTTVMVALRRGRRGLGIDLNPKYIDIAARRIFLDCPLFNSDGQDGAAE